ncbi:glycoside hydrolase family 27 protein [Desarmillaria tabescens]|uniref:Alpha-galactosidase n=1 Tax=Armillaria tabescens TaxID=1929756 RepID=A0AA39NEP9_ARMTA|nr:glycoside hydrolase family 27 protein [Desarmillaria tabescens]KAK0464255.1 glycoside hydrolase family 27 protein [Desarmillaria tabescens]
MSISWLGLPAILAFVSSVPSSVALDNSVGRLPCMCCHTWNAYFCNINETLVLESAQHLVSLGLADLGYEYVNIDDCYSERNRSSSGDILASAERFPSGMRNLTDQIHALGLKTGIYSDSGWFTCQLYPGSYQNEDRDARLFRQEWGFDLLKFDNCAVPFDDIIREGMVGKFSRMANAISNLAAETGELPMLFSICEWGRLQPQLWARRYGQSWRMTDDIGANWASIASIINSISLHSWASDFYGHNDLDMLQIGNGDLNYEESKAHFTAWSFVKSPLLIGTDLSSISEQTLSILKNTEIIAINQDPVVGTGVVPFRWGINADYTFDPAHPPVFWSGESQNGTVFMLINSLDEPADLFFNLTESPWIRAGRQYSVRDLWTHTDNGTAVRNFTAKAVPPHGVVALLLKDAGDEPKGLLPKCAFYEWWSDTWCIDKNGTRVPS